MKPVNFIDRTLMAAFPVYAEKRVAARLRSQYMLAQAGYDSAGGGSRWFRARGTSQNTENKTQAHIIRDNVRELERNNPYVGTAVNVIQSRTVGAGMKPKAKHPTNDRKRKLAQKLINEWAKTTACDYHGNKNLYGLQSLAMRSISLSGEGLYLKRLERDPRLTIPLKIELLEGDFIDNYKDTMASGGSIIQGVEIQKGSPSNYHLFNHHPGEGGGRGLVSKPVPSDVVAHGFEILRPGQRRGIPWGYNVLTKIKGLDDFQDARIEQQRMASCLMAYIYSEDDTAKGSPLPSVMGPGLIARLKGGEQMGFNTPPSVSGQGEFIKGEEYLIASAYGITREALTGDYSNTNFASGKMASIQMYTNVERWQQHIMQAQLLDKVGHWFIEAAGWVGIDLEGVTFEWTPPKKQILDLKNELPAIISEVRSGLNSLQNALRERGYDVEEILAEMKEDQDLIDQYGLILDIDARNTNKAGQLQQVSAAPVAIESQAEEEESDD